jgi:SSS family transporter
MTVIDYLIILLYFVGLLVLGGTLGKRIKSSKEMFIAGKNASWWMSGLSSYMTIFSAGTFVVWGGVAYRSGIVAIVVGIMLGISSLLVGLFLARKWSRMKINSPAEYLGVRFGQPSIRFYTIVGMIGRAVHTAVALYAVAIMVVAVMPLPAGHFLADPQTGHMSVTWAILIMGAITFIYTAKGGFIAVVMTDIVQFAVLIAMILIMVPLSFNSVGGVGEFISRVPDGFFALVSDQYSLGWMVLWCLLHFFMIGGDWPFVQRYISVPTSKDAKKSIYLVAALYVITPLIWYIPALVYRVINPDANPEQAFMLMSQYVLGVGMIGLMLAALMSATMSMVSGTLNVFANVFTYDIYKAFRPSSSDKTLMKVGRRFTFIYGAIVTTIAVLIPYLGGAEKVVVSILTLVISPLFIPSVWGLFSKRIGQKAIWWSMTPTFLVAILIKTGWIFKDFIAQHATFVDAFIGLVLPVTILSIIELILWKKGEDPGRVRLTQILGKEKKIVDESEKERNKKAGSMYSNMAFNLMFGTYTVIGVIMIAISLFGEESREHLPYGAIFLGISLIAFLLFYLKRNKKSINMQVKAP